MFWTCFVSPFSSFNNKKINLQVLQYKRITTRGYGNAQCYHQEESKLNSTINMTGDAHTLTPD